MNMFDEARSVMGMMKMCNMTQDEMAKKLGVSQSYVANKLRLLRLDHEEEARIIESGLTERHARALLRLDSKSERAAALERICERGLNVAESEALIDLLRDAQAPRKIGNAERISMIDVFMDTLKKSVETLSAVGINATRSVSYYGTKTYITLSIDESF